MSDNDAVLQGGPRDGTPFSSQGAGLVEVEIDGLVHRYILTGKRQESEGSEAAVYTYDGVVDPTGAQDGAEHAKSRMASPLADDAER